MASLSKVEFSDLYVHINGGQPTRIKPKDKKIGPLVPVPEKYSAWIEGLKKELREVDRDTFSLFYDGINYRVAKNKTSNGEVMASLRKISTEIPEMSALRIPAHVQHRIKFLGQLSGLIAISGPTGNGKSTTATSMVGSYLEDYGDVCVSIEDPIEYNLQGKDWGRFAACYQFEVTEDGDWANHLKAALRWAPRYIFLGELRSPEATAQALRAATSGHLVITTIHAGSIQESMHSLRQLAMPALGDLADILIADGFLASINQHLTSSGPKMKMLYAEGKGLGDPVRGLLRAGKIEQLETHIEKQNKFYDLNESRRLPGQTRPGDPQKSNR